MIAQKSIRLISITDPAPTSGFGASHRRDGGRDMRHLRKPAGRKAAAGRRPAVKMTGQAAAKNSGKARQAKAVRTVPGTRKDGIRRADIRNNGIRKNCNRDYSIRDNCNRNCNTRNYSNHNNATRYYGNHNNATRYYGRSRTLAGVHRSLSGLKSRMRTAIVVLTVMLCAIMLLGLKAPAREEGTRYYKYYTSITVGYHEDIIDIMDRYRDELHYETADDYMKEVSRINNLDYRTGDLLEVQTGDQLIVPYYSTEFR